MPGSERERRNAEALATEHLLDGLGTRSTGGVAITFVAQLLMLVVQIGYTAAMARLLPPRDFGIAAMAVAVTGLAGLFTDMGLSTASVQRKELDQNIVSALFAANMLLGVVAMLVCFGLALPAAFFFSDDRVTFAVLAYGAIIPVAAAAVQHQALLQRGMRLFALQVIGIASTVFGALVGVGAALFGVGYWALVAAAGATALARLALSWSLCPWRPGTVSDWSEVRGVVRFGAHLTGFNVTHFFATQADTALIGAFWGADATGIYSRAYQLMLLPLNAVSGPLGSVFLPALSRLQADPARWRDTFLRIFLASATLGCAIAAVLIVTGDKLVYIVYGPNWERSIAVFRWLSVSMLTTFPMGAMAWAFVSLGNASGMFRWGLISLGVLLAVFAGTVSFGVETLAIGYSCALLLLTPVIFHLALRGSAVSPWLALSHIVRLWIAAGCGIATGFFVARHDLGLFAGLIAEGLATTAAFGIVLVALVHRQEIWRRLPVQGWGLVRAALRGARA